MDVKIEDILSKHGFYLVEDSTKTYSHKNLRPTLSICHIDPKSKKAKFKVSTDKEYETSEQVIVPFQNLPENERTIIRTEEELINYYYY